MPAPVHRDVARKFVIGIVTSVAALAIGYIGAIVQTGGPLPVRSYTNVTAAFGNVGTLNPGKEVKQDGVRIGTVATVDYRNNQAVVTLRLDGDRPVYRDAHVSVGNSSALGKKFVVLDPGHPAAGLLGASTIPTTQTTDSNSLETVLDALDPQTRAALGSSLRELGGGLAGHGQDLNTAVRAAPDMLGDVGRLASAATSPAANIPGMLTSANQLVGRFQGREAQLSTLVDQMDSTLRAVSVDDGAPLAHTVHDLPPTLHDLRGGLSALTAPLADTRSALDTVRPGAQALGQSTPDLRGVLREAVTPLNKVPSVSGQAVPAVDDLTHTLRDARPLVPRLSETLARADIALLGLAPYASDAGRFFSDHDLLSGQFAPDKHYFAAMLTAPGLFSAGLPDPMAGAEPYPAPGGQPRPDSHAAGGNR